MLKKMIRRGANLLGYEIIPFSELPTIDDADFQKFADEYGKKMQAKGIDKIHYGCGRKLLSNGWVNVDSLTSNPTEESTLYIPVNLTSKHPFNANSFKCGFAEDFLEHLDQAESMIFLSEAWRTLQKGGVLRLSFPGLVGVLNKHYRSSDYEGANLGRHEAYTSWGHKHFYSLESLTTVGKHIGFSKVEGVKYGESQYPDLCGLDSRPDQQDINLYAELTK